MQLAKRACAQWGRCRRPSTRRCRCAHLLEVPAGRSALVSPVWTDEFEKLQNGIDQCEEFTEVRETCDVIAHREIRMIEQELGTCGNRTAKRSASVR
jgi:hypothetical protein